jgi:hypothetical protein
MPRETWQLLLLTFFYEIIQVRLNSDKSVGSFSCQVAAWVAIMFCNFYLVKNHKIANNSTSAGAREKLSTDLESLEFYYCLMCLTLKNQIVCSKNSHKYILSAKVLCGRNVPIGIKKNFAIFQEETPQGFFEDAGLG